MVKKLKWAVRLGPQEWVRYTYERPPGDPVELLGSVKRGMQVGALALVDGEYFQVIGDHMALLNTSQIARALAKAPAADGQSANKPTPYLAPTQKPAAAPVVIVKRKRTFVRPDPLDTSA